MTIRSRLPNVQPPIKLGGLAGGEILLSTLSGFTSSQTNVIGSLADSTIITAILATTSIIETELVVLSNIAGVLFFGYAVYEFLPKVFPTQLDVLTQRRSYRLASGITVVLFADILTRLLTAFTGDGAVSFFNLIVIPDFTGVVTIIFLLMGVTPLIICYSYVGVLIHWNIDNLEEATHEAERWMAIKEEKGANNSSNKSVKNRFSQIYTLGTMLAAPVIFLPIAVVAAGLMYPIPELISAGWGLHAITNTYSTGKLTALTPDPEQVDVEDSAFDLVKNTVRTTKGLGAVVITLYGFSTATALFLGSSSSAFPFISYGITVVSSEPLFTWSIIGMAITNFSATSFAVWFWIRVIRRLPCFLRAWEVAYTDTSTLSKQNLPENITRPYGMCIPFIITIVPSSSFLILLRADFYFEAKSILVGVYAFLWPMFILLLAYCVNRTRNADHNNKPQPPLSDSQALPTAIMAMFGSVLLFNMITTYITAAARVRNPVEQEFNILIVFALLIALILYLRPDLSARSKDKEGWRSYQDNIFVFTGGAVIAMWGWLKISPIWSQPFYIVGLGLIVASLPFRLFDASSISSRI